MSPAVLQLLIFLGALSLSLAQSCDTAINVNRRIKPTGRLIKKYQDDHEVAGLTRECIETDIPVEKKCNDYPYIKCKKMELLSAVCTVTSTPVILNELMEYSADDCVLVARAAIKAIASIGVRLALSTEWCMQRLLPLLSSKRSHVLSAALVALCKVAMSCDCVVTAVVLPHLPLSVLSVCEPEGRAALIWLVGELGMSLHHAPYMLEAVINNISCESSVVKCQLITSVTKVFLRRPSQCQEMLGRLLESCINTDSDADVKDRALLYYRMLRLDVHQVKRVVNCKRKATFALAPTILPLCEFNTLSVMYEITSSAFIQQVCPYSVAYGPSSKENAVHWSPGAVAIDGTFFKESVGVMKKGSSAEVYTACDVLLDPLAKMSTEDFETLWLKMPPVRNFKVRLSSVPTSKEFTWILQSQSIKTMAYGSLDSVISKMYFYAQHVLTHQVFLVEVCIAVETSMLSFTLKCQDHKQATSFVKLFFETLEAFANQYHRVQWRVCEDVPTYAKNINGILFEQNLYLGGGFSGSSKADSVVYVYSFKLDLWKILPSSPLKWFTIVALNSQIVLVGGKETHSDSSEYTNKLSSWDCKNGQWKFLLPVMLNRRASAIALSHAGSIVVAGGNKGVLDYNVEVLTAGSKQWKSVTQLPLSCFSLNVFLNDHWYFYREYDHSVIRIHMKNLTALPKQNELKIAKTSHVESSLSCNQDEQSSENSTATTGKWEKYCQLPFTPVKMCSIQGHLIAALNDSSKGLVVFAYTPGSDTWRNIGNLPDVSSTASFVSSDNKDMFLVGGDSSSTGSQCSSKLWMVMIGANQ